MSTQPKPRRVDLSPDNFIAGVAGQMNATELGVYWMVCLLIYSHGGATVCDERRLSGLLPGTHWRTIRAALQRLHDLGKMSSEHGQTMVKGCSGPLEEAAKRISRARENGSKGGRPTSEINGIEKPTGSFTEKLPSPSPSPPQPKKKETPSLRSGEPAKRKTCLPDQFPDESSKAWATDKWIAKGRTDLLNGMADEIAKFRDHHTANDTRSADWPASWRTWTTKAMNFTKQYGNGDANGNFGAKRRTSTDQHLAGIASLIEDIRGDGRNDT